jgi:diaminopimelate epimerase
MSATISFYKLQGAGNDFVAIDNRDLTFSLDELINLTPKLCDRRFGIGADGLLALFPGTDSTSYTMVYRNADGSDAGMCGNGGRCIARLATSLGVAHEHAFGVHQQIYKASVDEMFVIIDLPAKPIVQLVADNDFYHLAKIHTGTEHVTTEVDAKTLTDHDYLRKNGNFLRYDGRFAPKGTNVNFYAVETPNAIKLVTYERGVEDLTLACGTGALASAIAHHHFSNSDVFSNEIRVSCMGGDLFAGFSYDNASKSYFDLTLKGPAEIVYQGIITI